MYIQECLFSCNNSRNNICISLSLLRQLVCMVGLVAFLSTQPDVAYIEDIPQVVGTNTEVSERFQHHLYEQPFLNLHLNSPVCVPMC